MYQPISGTGSGTAPVVNLSWPFLDKSHVKAIADGVAATLTWTGAAQVTFSSSVANGKAWSVYRDTPIDAPLIDFTDGAIITAGDLDSATSQQLYRQQEVQAKATPRATVTTLSVGSTPTAAITQQPDGWTLALGLPATSATPNGNYGDITVSSGGSTWTINGSAVTTAKLADAAVTLAKLQNATGAGVLGALGAGAYSQLTGTQLTTLLDAFTSGLKGLVPASGGGTSNFLRADGTWALPPGGGVAGTTTNVLTINNGGSGVASGGTFNGSAPITISYNSVGAPKADGTGASGTWNIAILGNAATATTAGSATTATTAAQVAHALTYASDGSGVAAGSTFDGSASRIVSYNSVGAAPAVTPISSFSGNKTAATADNNVYLKFTGTTATLTLDGTPAGGTALIVVNRGSGVLSLTVASGVYKNGASTTATTASLAVGGKITLFHEGGGVWTADGSGLS